MTVIDYLGHRVVAVAHLSASPETLSYGQIETGSEFKTAEEAIAKDISEALYLKPHQASTFSGVLYGSVETECLLPSFIL